MTMILVKYSQDKFMQKCIKMTFLAITTSGNSRNILEALNECKNLGIKSILLSGKSGGIAKSISDYSIIITSNSTQVIQKYIY